MDPEFSPTWSTFVIAKCELCSALITNMHEDERMEGDLKS